MADTINNQIHAGRCRLARAGVRRSVLAAAGGRAAVEGGSTCDNGSAAPPAGANPSTTRSDDAAIPADSFTVRRPSRGMRVNVEKPFTGDFDEMVKRRVIRVGVTFNRTHYFIDKGQERGLTYESVKLFEKDLNADLKTGRLQGARGPRADAAGSAVHRAAERQGRHGCRDGHDQARARKARRLLAADPHQRQRSRGHRARCAADRDTRRSRRPRGVRPEGERLLRESQRG